MVRGMRQRWVYMRWFALLIGLLTGALVGLAVYWGSRLAGAALYTLCGTAAGGVAAMVFYAYSRSVRLTQLTVSIPNLTGLTFAVTPSNEGVAWRLFVESVTRISTQPLDQGSGVIREALNSLYVLFQSVRSILLEVRPTAHVGSTPAVELLAIGMLNVQMRPFMAKWHARLAERGQKHPGSPQSEWPENAQCRAEMETMRQGLLEYVRGLGQLAGVRNVEVMLGGADTVEPR